MVAADHRIGVESARRDPDGPDPIVHAARARRRWRVEAGRRELEAGTNRPSKRWLMKRLMSVVILVAAFGWSGQAVLAFCGFYVAKADTKIFNKASQVVLVRHEDKTVLTMANDFKGDPKEFAVVIPVPTVLQKDQIHVGDKALLDHLDAYSAPRLVEYFDGDPCSRMRTEEAIPMAAAPVARAAKDARDQARSLGVTIEAQYT